MRINKVRQRLNTVPYLNIVPFMALLRQKRPVYLTKETFWRQQDADYGTVIRQKRPVYLTKEISDSRDLLEAAGCG